VFLAYASGLVVGGLITSLLIYLLGSLWRPSSLVVGVAALVLGVLRFVRPDNLAVGGWKVPRHWSSWGRRRYLGVFGLFLGMGFVTTMPSPAMVALMAWMWHLHALVLIIVTFEAFVAGRLLTTLVSHFAQVRSTQDVVLTVNAVQDKTAYVSRAEAVLSVILGLSVLLALLT
jgi:MFS family permease